MGERNPDHEFFDKMREALGGYASQRVFAFAQRGRFALRFGPMSLEAADDLVQYGQREGIQISLSADCGESVDYQKLDALFPVEERDKRLAERDEMKAAAEQFAGLKPANVLALLRSLAHAVQHDLQHRGALDGASQIFTHALGSALAAFEGDMIERDPAEPPLKPNVHNTSIGMRTIASLEARLNKGRPFDVMWGGPNGSEYAISSLAIPQRALAGTDSEEDAHTIALALNAYTRDDGEFRRLRDEMAAIYKALPGGDGSPSSKAKLLMESFEQITARADKLEDAVRWALGENGEFTPPIVDLGDGKTYEPRPHWWRKELRQRAFGDPA